MTTSTKAKLNNSDRRTNIVRYRVAGHIIITEKINIRKSQQKFDVIKLVNSLKQNIILYRQTNILSCFACMGNPYIKCQTPICNSNPNLTYDNTYSSPGEQIQISILKANFWHFQPNRFCDTGVKKREIDQSAHALWGK